MVNRKLLPLKNLRPRVKILDELQAIAGGLAEDEAAAIVEVLAGRSFEEVDQSVVVPGKTGDVGGAEVLNEFVDPLTGLVVGLADDGPWKAAGRPDQLHASNADTAVYLGAFVWRTGCVVEAEADAGTTFQVITRWYAGDAQQITGGSFHDLAAAVFANKIPYLADEIALVGRRRAHVAGALLFYGQVYVASGRVGRFSSGPVDDAVVCRYHGNVIVEGRPGGSRLSRLIGHRGRRSLATFAAKQQRQGKE